MSGSGADEAAGASPPSGLRGAQAWMLTALTHPGGAGVPDGWDPDVAGHLTASATLTAEQRLAIYRRSYLARLLECMESTFPALRHAVGPALFRQFAQGYLQAHPPTHPSLVHLGDHFARYLADTRPDAAAPPDEREAWPDFLIDLAELEHAHLTLYDGPGIEGTWLPGRREVLAVPVDRRGELRPVPVPILRLFAFRYPVHAYLLAVRRDEAPPLPAPRPTFLAATRRRFQVRIHELTPPQHAVLSAFDGRRTLGEACALAGVSTSAEAADWLLEWAERGVFAALA